MRNQLLPTAVLLVSLALQPTALRADGYSFNFEPATHNVERTSSPPTIDGVIRGSEWGSLTEIDCSPGDMDTGVPVICNVADSWVNLTTNAPDSHNLRFRMLWDDTHLYVMGRSDYTDFVPGETVFGDAPDRPNFAGTGYATSFYIDPNRDEERDWDPLMPVADDTVDGYQIAWDVYEGFTSRQPTLTDMNQPLRNPLDGDGQPVNDYFGGFQLEAHVNAATGNQGAWELPDDGPNGNYRDDVFPGLQFAQYAYTKETAEALEVEPGLVWEWAIPWTIFNATNPDRLVTAEEAAARPEMVIDTRSLLIEDDPDNPGGIIVVPNPDFNEEVPNVGQIPGIEAFIGNAGEPDLRFSDEAAEVYLESGLYAPDGPSAGDVWAFEASVFSNDFANPSPSWSEPAGGDPTRTNSFPLWGTVGHGQLVFLPEDTKVPPEDPDPDPSECMVPAGLIPGDLDENGDVGFADFLILSGNFGLEDTGYSGGDIDCDGDVGFGDFLVLSGNFGRSSDAVASVPEMTWNPLLLIGVLTCLTRRRNR